jgi:nitroreductase
MDVHKAISERRAYRSLRPVGITKELIRDLARHAQLAPSCSNNQPARFVFVHDAETLPKIREVLSSGNLWARSASMIIAVFSKRADDCIIRDREYHQFDCGLASGFLILRATELGLVAHPIAGFSPKKTREILGIPEEYSVITLIIIGDRSEEMNPAMTEQQQELEKSRPKRKPLQEIAFFNRFTSG